MKSDIPDYSLPRGYWSPPGRSRVQRSGDQTPERIYTAVGCALTQWEGVEEAVQTLLKAFAKRNSMPVTDPLLVIFGSIENSTGRLAAVRNLGQVYFHETKSPKELRDPFNRLDEHLRNAARIRNDLAHGRVVHFSIRRATAKNTYVELTPGCHLVAADYMTGRNDHLTWHSFDDLLLGNSSRNIYTFDVIEDFIAKFRTLEAMIREYAGRLMQANDARLSSGTGTKSN